LGCPYLYYYGNTSFSYFTSKPLPEGKKGIQAELLTDKIQEAINQKAWISTRGFIYFYGNHHYLWDKKSNLVLCNGVPKGAFNSQTMEGITIKTIKN
jgi:hypothetical protein